MLDPRLHEWLLEHVIEVRQGVVCVLGIVFLIWWVFVFVPTWKL